MSNLGKKKPVGRPRALNFEEQAQILAFISAGGSRCKAAQCVGIHPSTIANEAQANPDF